LDKKEFSSDKKDPTELRKGNDKSKYDDMTKEELIKIIRELENEIRQLKSEKVEANEIPEFNEVLSKRESEFQEAKLKLEKLSSCESNLGKGGDKNPLLDSKTFLGIILILITGMIIFLFINK
jgi:hypothetical protein